MFDEKVVIHFRDGGLLIGLGDSFLPWEEETLVMDLHDKIHHVPLADVKLVCFVKSFESDPATSHQASPPLQFVAVPGRRVRLKFRDGEEIVGLTTVGEIPPRGFFLTPLNPNTNNKSLFVNSAEVAALHFET